MQTLKNWMLVFAAMASIGGGVALVESTSARSALAQVVDPPDDGWRFHDGHWSLWNRADKRWYYTDGNHWFYNNGNAWAPYRFDKEFGRKGFERGAYRPPAEGVEVKLPNHKIYVGP